MSRVHRIGTIFSRVSGLIEKGHLRENEKPLWFDVYKRFPPIQEPLWVRKEPEITVRDIFYEEDRLRAKIHKEFKGKLGFVDLKSNEETYSEALLKTCQEYISKGMSEDEAIQKVKESSVVNPR